MAVSQPDRIEKAGRAFHAETERAYETLYREHPERFVAV